MIRYLFLCCSRTISVPKAVQFFNHSTVSRNKKQKILQKTGILFYGKADIKIPFYYETGNIVLGDRVFINLNAVFLDNARITLGEKTMLGPNVTICTAHHPTTSDDRSSITAEPVTIGKNVWIGAGSVILPGVTIGDNSIIGANSVVCRNVPENVLFAGIPAIFKKHLHPSNSRASIQPITSSG